MHKKMSDQKAEVRLQKFLADAGLASRRKAEAWIEQGLVDVNGQVAKLGAKVDPEKDKVRVEGRLVKIKGGAGKAKIVLAMHKPKGYVCTNEDPFNPKTVFDLLPKEYAKEKLFCAGRLDKDSEGLLIITNDGELSNQLMHPSGGILKRYHVTLSKPYNPKVLPLLVKGIQSDGETLYAKKIIPAKSGPLANCRLEVHLEQGRKREIRRMFEHFGYFVDRLKRFQMGKFSLRGIAKGKIKRLNKADIELLLQK